MTLTEAQVKAMVLIRVGDIDSQTLEPAQGSAGGLVAGHLDVIWDRHADKQRIPGLRELYTLRDCLDVVLGAVAPLIDVEYPDRTDSLSQLFKQRSEQRALYQKEIERFEARVAAVRDPAVGEMEASAPTTPPVGWPDANSPRYGGSPYYPPRSRW